MFHRILSRPGWPDFVFAFHDQEELGPRIPTQKGSLTSVRYHDPDAHTLSAIK